VGISRQDTALRGQLDNQYLSMRQYPELWARCNAGTGAVGLLQRVVGWRTLIAAPAANSIAAFIVSWLERGCVCAMEW
jgi:hypothetical protein